MPSPEARAAVAPYADSLSRPAAEVADELESFSVLLRKWQRVQNLVSRETLGGFWDRHVADSMQLLPLLRPEDRTILDLGSGGGLPAIPLAIASKGARNFILVEPNGRKASFLRTVSRELQLPLRVENRRAEELDPLDLPEIDVITSRALAPLAQLCAMAVPLFGPKTRAILHKGREHVDELAESGAVWHHDVLVTKSATDERGVLLELTKLRLKIN
jgi:16S rRNA (guanine527-N7)-methyltransferase